MKLFNKYQSRTFQFALDVLYILSCSSDPVSTRELETLAKQYGLGYPDQVLDPLVKAGVLTAIEKDYRLGEKIGSFHFPMGQIERDYLQYILHLPEAGLFLQERTIEKLKSGGGNIEFFEPIQRFEPAGEEIPEYPGPEGFRKLLQAIRQKRMIRYEYCTNQNANMVQALAFPWKLEFSAYDRRWWVILYLPEEDRTVKALLGNLRNICLDDVVKISDKKIQRAIDRLLAPELMVLEIERKQGALERCFMVFENQMFVETSQVSPEKFRMAFQYYRFDETEILRRLLYLGPMVKLVGPDSAKERMLGLVCQALEP